jgi:hypothetical protein
MVILFTFSVCKLLVSFVSFYSILRQSNNLLRFIRENMRWQIRFRTANAEQENPDFQGFVFEGKASESGTCNALEWIYSYGDGSAIEPDKSVTIDNPKAIKALDIASRGS